MAGPLNGLGQQQIPLATTFKPGQNDTQVRAQSERQPQANQVQPPGVQASQTQNTETKNPNAASFLLRANAEGRDESNSTGRGSLVDITI